MPEPTHYRSLCLGLPVLLKKKAPWPNPFPWLFNYSFIIGAYLSQDVLLLFVCSFLHAGLQTASAFEFGMQVYCEFVQEMQYKFFIQYFEALLLQRWQWLAVSGRQLQVIFEGCWQCYYLYVLSIITPNLTQMSDLRLFQIGRGVHHAHHWVQLRSCAQVTFCLTLAHGRQTLPSCSAQLNST